MEDFIGRFFAAIDAQALSVVQSLYEALATALEPVFFAGLTVYIAVWGYQMAFGTAPVHVWTVLWNIARAMLIYTMAFRWSEFSAMFADILTRTPDEFAAVVCNAMGGQNCGTAQGSVSNALSTLWVTAQDAARTIAAGGSGFSAIGLIILAFILIVVTLVFLAIACSLVMLGKLALFVILGLAPFFIALALFEFSSFLFNGWIRETIKHALVPVIVYGMVGFFLKLSQNAINNLAASTSAIDAAMTTVAPFIFLMFVGWFVLPQSLMIAAGIVGGFGLHDRMTPFLLGKTYQQVDRRWNQVKGQVNNFRNAMILRAANNRAAGMGPGTNNMFDGGSGGARAVGRQIQQALRNTRR